MLFVNFIKVRSITLDLENGNESSASVKLTKRTGLDLEFQPENRPGQVEKSKDGPTSHAQVCSVPPEYHI